MKIAGIPTLADGFRMRSRLEARWAAFFTALGWQWEYEPFDCAGWIPDFLIRGAVPTLVEVKPITAYDISVAEKCLSALPGGYHFLLLGAGPFVTSCPPCLATAELCDCCSGKDPVIGWADECLLSDYARYGLRINSEDLQLSDKVEWCSAPAHLVQLPTGIDYRASGLAIPRATPSSELVGFIDGKWRGLADSEPLDWSTVRQLWAEAANATQWKAPR